jgi:hypothetical protein
LDFPLAVEEAANTRIWKKFHNIINYCVTFCFLLVAL